MLRYKFNWEYAAEDRKIDVRKCDICGKPMIDGYCVGDGEQYYCSSECLAKVFTEYEWDLVYQTDGGYYTEWYDEYDENGTDIICNDLLPMWKEEADSERGEKTMTNNAIRNAIACALHNCTNRERQFAAEYIELNPAEKERRNRDAELVILGVMSMYHEIKRQLGKE